MTGRSQGLDYWRVTNYCNLETWMIIAINLDVFY